MQTLISHEREVPAGVQADRDAPVYPAELPAFGTIGDDENSHGQAISYFTKIGQTAVDARDDHVEQAADNALVFQWGKTVKPADGDPVANDIQSIVMSVTGLQTVEPYAIFIKPVQTRDKAQVFWIGPPVDDRVAALTGLPYGIGMEPVLDEFGQPMLEPLADPMTGMPAADPMTGGPAVRPMMQPATTYTPMDEVTAWQIKKMAATGAFPSEWFVSVDDRLVADVYQTIFDVMWKESKIDNWLYENVLKTNIYGYQGSYYSWDHENRRHIVRDISIKQLLLDPKAEGTDFEQQNCPGFEVVMDVDQAKADWPQLTDILDQYAREGEPARLDSLSDFGIASDRHFGQRTVTFRIHWFRNQMVPMLEHEAEAAGLVYKDVDPLTGEEFYRSTQVQEVPDVAQVGSVAADPLGQGQPNDSSAGPSLPVAGDDVPTDAPPQTADAALLHAPPVWPMKLGIRQVAVLAQAKRVVQDIRCEHWSIPMLLNVAIPLPSQPFGQGLPEKLKGMQAADIRMLAAVVKYAETFSMPGSMVAQSVADALKKKLKRTHIDPSESIVCPDDLFERFGENAVLWFKPPPLPEAVPHAMEMLNQRMDKTSGHPEVLQGKAPSPSSSGRLVEALQSGVAGQFGFQAQWTQKNVERLANLMHYTNLWRLELADVMDIYSRLPEPIMEMVLDRARRGKWDIQIEASGQAGGQARRKLQEGLALFTARSATGEPALPMRMLRELANIDHEEASIAYQLEIQAAMPAAQPGQEQPGEDPQDQTKPPSDGQGTANN